MKESLCIEGDNEKRDSVPVALGIAISMAPLCNRYKRQGQAGVEGDSL